MESFASSRRDVWKMWRWVAVIDSFVAITLRQPLLRQRQQLNLRYRQLDCRRDSPQSSPSVCIYQSPAGPNTTESFCRAIGDLFDPLSAPSIVTISTARVMKTTVQTLWWAIYWTLNPKQQVDQQIHYAGNLITALGHHGWYLRFVGSLHGSVSLIVDSSYSQSIFRWIGWQRLSIYAQNINTMPRARFPSAMIWVALSCSISRLHQQSTTAPTCCTLSRRVIWTVTFRYWLDVDASEKRLPLAVSWDPLTRQAKKRRRQLERRQLYHMRPVHGRRARPCSGIRPQLLDSWHSTEAALSKKYRAVLLGQCRGTTYCNVVAVDLSAAY